MSSGRCVELTQYGVQCTRDAYVVLRGDPLCWQHRNAREDRDMGDEVEKRWLESAALEPSYPGPNLMLRFLRRMGSMASPCDVCGGPVRSSTIVVHPITLQRIRLLLCASTRCRAQVSAWQGSAMARRARVAMDYLHEARSERQFIRKGIPMQFASVSRATIREFIESGLDAATVDHAGTSASGLNSTIATLGFADEVYAETRSGQTVLRRIGVKPETVA